ncbi:chorismate-binding protein [Trinickia dinghuensis]|uniref:Chloride transporter n=1 Tax=Trinickia dinghuensis TaxID=2291023 RepID=A0A3D8JR51_9BURK|nr:bifunctional anthranilate synthase component I family protein/class IV aminotransferase [Trinickia dinghuensis]RDU95024.1 chloride transporter [Trinickia dinghuensis]
MNAEQRGAVFALLDDCDASAATPTSRLYTGFARAHVCTDPSMLDAVCAEVERDVRGGLHAVMLGDYEFGRDLEFGKRLIASAAVPASVASYSPSRFTQRGDASLRFLLFERCDKRSREQVDAWLAALDGGMPPEHGGAVSGAGAGIGTGTGTGEAEALPPPPPSVAGAANVVESVTPEAFATAIAAVHEALRAGESYQINYTYRLAFEAFGSPVGLYRRLRARQPVRYGALIALPGDEWVLSCSPELFVEKQGGRLRTRPMKGTTARGASPEDDARAAAFLRSDPKNRAENLMIVDLLRNDLSRVAKTGSVCVPALFSVEPYPSIWGMTSTIEADLRERTSFAGILRALFPCGSITGAPKHRTMQLIDEIETTPRGLYTGTIGWVEAPAATSAHGEEAGCGDFCLSVTIRTLTLGAPSGTRGTRRGTMGVGGGIVLDSVAADEYAECRLKAKFLTGADPGLQLFETMYGTRNDGVRYLERHLARLGKSAAALDFLFDESVLRERLAKQCAQFPAGVAHRVRLALSKDGSAQITSAVLGEVMRLADAGDTANMANTVDAANTGYSGGAAADRPAAPDNAFAPVGVLLAPEHGFEPVRSDDFLLRHKSTSRAEFDRAWRLAEARGCFDTLFFNERGALTEGGRSNVFVKLDGRWYTPPLSAGLLPGVMRQVLLEDPAMQASERTLTQADLLRAEALVICNALRGALPARIVRNA